MITRGDIKFNCCESTLIRIDNKKPLPDFGSPVMRAASNFGGGVAGWGSVCGAVSGAAMAVGLLLGTEGTEGAEEFQSKRDRMRAVTQEFAEAFEGRWGHANCYDLLGLNTRTPEGKKRYEEMKERGETHCAEYVEWAAEKVLEVLAKHSV
ncbi:C_GCAxxG_C_C family protein [Candidatus Bathyarchaeota archaeon]|nr:C_GCAxxG_C_C family protein [Candidatus Bathyarchaeota archaeon]